MLYITLRQYEYIVGIADAGSLTDAAARLNVSQPSLSVAITRVEQRLAGPIFVRGKGAALQITPYGHRIVEGARAVLAVAAGVERQQNGARNFVLGCFEDIAPWYLAPALDRLKARFPSAVFQGREGRFSDLARDLSEGRIDCAITYDVGFEGNFARRDIATIAPVAFMSTQHPLATRRAVTLDDVISYPMILFSEDQSEGFMRQVFERVQLQPLVAQRVASLEMMRSLAAHGVGVGISYSRPPTDVSYDGKALVTLPITTPQATAQISLIWSCLRGDDPQFSEILGVMASDGGPLR